MSIIKKEGKAAVALSGGVDSSFLAYAAVRALGKDALALTIVSPMLPKNEINDALRVAKEIGITHVLINEDHIEDEVAENPAERCYFCKKKEFSAMLKAAAERGIATVFDGSNLDDEGDYRPGLKALSELNIISPLREAALCKADIRELSRSFNLPTWDKPAFACLASRIPYGEKIDKEKLKRIELAEDILRNEFGFRQFRVRSHGELARIEVAPEERSLFFDETTLDKISAKLKQLGFLYVALELEGYKMGNMNKVLKGTSA
ncbi:MAG: ATP-dependent sacrificial sulfur transferase LarE [Spirochaetaceae bacterium]|nr:ATP-dependent sacrificial sulfur transferase LarE [Spirochaetaceae bacterium]